MLSQFIRPEVLAVWHRWRGLIIATVLVCVGATYALAGGGIFRIIGVGLLLLGAAWGWESLRRAKFPTAGGGPGVVDLVERRLSYFGPQWGGSISLDDLEQVRIRTTAIGSDQSKIVWEFTDSEGQRLSVPSNAEGADVLFDVLTVLSGVNYDVIAQANEATKAQGFLVWTKSQPTITALSDLRK